MQTKYIITLISAAHILGFIIGFKSHDFLMSFAPKPVTASNISMRITEEEKAINAKLETPEMKALCYANARYSVLLDESARLEKELSITNAKRTATVIDIGEKTKAMTSVTLNDMKSVKTEARIMINGK